MQIKYYEKNCACPQKKRSKGLDFCLRFFREPTAVKTRNRALFIRIARIQNSLKRFLTNDIVWVLLLFSKKNLVFMFDTLTLKSILSFRILFYIGPLIYFFFNFIFRI